ncbi:unnamed protein product [Caenorhabditis sp. 36 PRJEB53466]|nr:unnamed protein product [Caenorhabditis sp. 36 PRJEB53466]
MPTWVVVMLAVIAGILAVLLILILFFCIRSKDKKQPPSPAEPNRRLPTRAESTIGIRPKIPNPIYTINTVRAEREGTSIADTLTTRKLSQMFDSKKRFSTAFSHRSAYFDFENSPLPRHKEYLDFNDIENMVPTKKQVTTPDRPSIDFLNEIHDSNQKSKEGKSSDEKKGQKSNEKRAPVKQVFAEEEHTSFSQNTRPIYAN